MVSQLSLAVEPAVVEVDGPRCWEVEPVEDRVVVHKSRVVESAVRVVAAQSKLVG